MHAWKLRAFKLTAVSLFGSLTLFFGVSQHTTHAGSLSQSEATNPLPQTDETAALGLNHFMAHCATCHGDTGKGDSAKGKAVGAADLTSARAQAGSDPDLFRVISGGKPGTAMPAFGKTHSPAEIWQTVSFLRRLPSLTPEERSRLEAKIPQDARHRHGDKDSGHEHQHEHPKEKAGHDHDHHDHEGAAPAKDQPPAEKQKTDGAKADDEHAGHDMASDHSGHANAAGAGSMMSTVTGGPFKSMYAIGSGTSLLPASVPGYMWHWSAGDWMVMAHGDIKIGVNHQGGPRGVTKAESQNWLMLMAERPAGAGRLMLRGMFSAEPWTAPRRGFPELFQTGEVFEGRPIIDAQHPHDLFMELAAAYTLPLSENVSIHLYGGPVAEPALGPVAFMHRASAMENPAAPLSHHWHDSTHIAHGVFTAGVTAGRFRIESSIFRGAEPDEDRTTIDFGKLDSYSARVWFTPTPNWSMQVSYGYLTNPEALEPGDLRRLTASISHNRSWRDGNLATSLIWGRNDESHGVSNSYLLESTVNFLDKNYLYTRMELGDKIGLLQENIFGRPGLAEDHDDDHDHDGRTIRPNFHVIEEPELPGVHHEDTWFRVGAFTFGGVRDIVSNSTFRLGLGADVTFYHVPDGLKQVYGSSPKSYHFFLRLRPGRMRH
ncbi:MAG TPA: c-type cytochrome [Blastocatellia bacterium]|nr:c-type cytochrome [Blastocatellia bacterium]